jgi:hemolysin D
MKRALFAAAPDAAGLIMTQALTLRLQAALDLLRRYGAIFGQPGAIRKELDPPQRLAHEAAFLPAALELRETPVSPAPRIVPCGC